PALFPSPDACIRCGRRDTSAVWAPGAGGRSACRAWSGRSLAPVLERVPQAATEPTAAGVGPEAAQGVREDGVGPGRAGLIGQLEDLLMERLGRRRSDPLPIGLGDRQ